MAMPMWIKANLIKQTLGQAKNHKYIKETKKYSLIMKQYLTNINLPNHFSTYLLK